MLEWEKLLNSIRRKKLDGNSELLGTAAGRLELERDYDRILFSAPTRRMADKTQVFPMEQHDSIRTRLTHSHEVSNLARSIGVKLAFEYPQKVFGVRHEELQVKRNVPPLLAAVGLAHDLGNPPFGHQGEMAIQQWFQELNVEQKGAVPIDFLEFDGNAQSFRLLTRLQVLNDKYGLNLCVATLAALIKYPSVYGDCDKGGYKKWGIFKSEEEIANVVWNNTGLTKRVRHPFAHIMEACDDIAYSIIDAEDIVKKGYASFYDLMDFLSENSGGDEVVRAVIEESVEQNRKFKSENLSSRELNDISMQMFRVKSISEMIPSVTDVFVDKINGIMSQNGIPGFTLIKESSCSALCALVKKFDYKMGYAHRDVLKLELSGSNYIKKMMTYLWGAISTEDSHRARPLERYIFGDISENYRRVYADTQRDLRAQCQLICDVLSGMTENFLIKKTEEYDTLSCHAKI